MPKRSIAYFKGKWVPGFVPGQNDWIDFFDSFAHLDAIPAVNAEVVNDAINDYDTDLKEETVNGVVDTLGDVFKVFQGYSDIRNINNELKWSGLPGKPSQKELIWDEQVIDFYSSAYVSHFSTFDDQISSPETMTTKYRSMNSLRIRNNGNVDDGKKINILDIICLRRKFTTAGATFHEIVGVVIGITPKISLA